MSSGVLKQPRALYSLFAAEMWERFSYYGMRAILVLYMVHKLGFADKYAAIMYGTFTAFVYMTPVIGGYLADKYLGFVKAVMIGAILIVLGHLCLSMPFHIGNSNFFFYFGLSSIIVGTGFFKSNISTIVGTLYGKLDGRRDAGFTIFYMGINLGALISTSIVGFIAVKFGWHAGFSLAAFGMILGMIVFWRSHKKGIFPASAYRIKSELMKKKVCSALSWNHILFLGTIAALVLATVILSHADQSGTKGILLVFAAIALLYVIYEFIRSKAHEKAGIALVMFLSFVSLFFFAAFEQAGSSITLFTDRMVDRHLFGIDIPTATFQSINPFFILILSPFLSKIWVALSNRGLEPSVATKFSLGMFFLAIGFGALAMGAHIAMGHVQAGVIWVILGYFFQTVGELCLSPIGLSAVTRFSPIRITGMLMGMWFLASSFANYIAGIVASFSGVNPNEAHVEAAEGYYNVFHYIFVTSMIVAVVVFVLIPVIKVVTRVAQNYKQEEDSVDTAI